MRVLWLTNTPAGADRVLNTGTISGGWLQALNKALQHRVELHVAFFYPRNCDNFSFEFTQYYPICHRHWKWQIIKDLVLGSRSENEYLQVLLTLIDRINPDIIHIHGTENPFGIILEKVDIPVIVSLQGNVKIISHKYFSGIERKYLNVYHLSIKNLKAFILKQTFKSNYKKLVNKVKWEEAVLKKCKYLIGRTDWDKRISRIFSPQSIYFHNDEILRDSFYENVWKSHWNDKIVLFSTITNSFFKGLETICLALFELNKLGVNIEWRIAGLTESDQIIAVVKKKIREKYPLNGLIFLGSKNESSIVDELLKADIFILASHIENSSNSLCEAMILGLPCIATNAGGTGSLLKDKEEGILIQDGDPWSMAGAILELLNKPILAEDYGRNARIRALKRHDKETIINGLISIYSKVIE
jgi:glycosyltransferase involved in cell wall biosynthesis